MGRRTGAWISNVEPSADGFGVTYLCTPKSPDCLHGSCWHMDRVRRMVREWFLLIGPKPRLGTWEPTQRETGAERTGRMSAKEKKAWAQQKEREAEESRVRALAASRRFWDRFHARWGDLPASAWVWREPNGIGRGLGDDIDAGGSWGRMVRMLEDIDDER